MNRSLGVPGAAIAMAMAACTASPPPASGPVPEPDAPTEEAAPEYTPLTEGLPPLPRIEGAPQIRVMQPVPGSTRPSGDSTAIYGTVGTAGALLRINGETVPVAPNGAFIAYLPVPADGIWRLEARRGESRSEAMITQRVPAPGAGGSVPSRNAFTPALPLVVSRADTLATGSDAAFARPTPTGTYRWFFPAGTRLAAAERVGSQYRVRLDSVATAWIDTAAVRRAPAGAAQASRMGTVQLRPTPDWVDVRIPAGGAPFRIEADSTEWRVTVYQVASAPLAREIQDPLVDQLTVRAMGSSAVVGLRFRRQPWGYKAFHDPDGTLVLRVRRPPAIDPAAPLRGRRIVIDPGHPPAGAVGPTGLREAEANLAIALPLAEMLRQGGAQVVMTRTDQTPVELAARTAIAVREDAELLVSVHNNAFGEAQNPFRSFHTTVYHFQPFARDLAQALDSEIAAVTRLRDLGARAENLALVRPTWFPSALTESVFMPIPEQENALRDANFVRRLAEAHLRGIEAFLRGRAGR